MTGIDLVDRGLGCDAQPQDGERCYLEPIQRERTLLLISHGLTVMLTSQHAAIANSKLHKATKEDRFWDGLIEILWLSLTGPLIGPIAGAIARSVSGLAVPAAELGLRRTAWKLAGVSADTLTEPIAIGFKGMRRELSAAGAPKDRSAHLAFLSHLQSLAGPASVAMLEGLGAWTDVELVAFYGALKDPEVASVATYGARIAELLSQFDANRIEDVGTEQFGREVAKPQRVKVRGREYVVLLEAFGIRNSALALNGAAAGASMESLTFVRMIERNMHALALSEYQRKHEPSVGEIIAPGPEVIDFDDANNRAAHPWFGDAYRAIKAQPNASEITAGDDAAMFGRPEQVVTDAR